jgi:TnpA family transposase
MPVPLRGVTRCRWDGKQELSVLCLRVLQAALVYVNTLMVQDVLADEEWAAQLTGAASPRCSGLASPPMARSSST